MKDALFHVWISLEMCFNNSDIDRCAHWTGPFSNGYQAIENRFSQLEEEATDMSCSGFACVLPYEDREVRMSSKPAKCLHPCMHREVSDTCQHISMSRSLFVSLIGC